MWLQVEISMSNKVIYNPQNGYIGVTKRDRASVLVTNEALLTISPVDVN